MGRFACNLRRPRYALPSVGGARSFSDDPLLTTLLRNRELSREEAVNELRWIREEARGDVQRQAAAIFGALMPKKEDLEAMRGLESGVVLGLVERRAQGEPLQYILGKSSFNHLSHALIPLVISKGGEVLVDHGLTSRKY
jgi:methylase of polypeptide subunit release factors